MPFRAQIIREETDDGRILFRVLRDIAEGRIEDTKPNHRIGAVKELLRHGPDHSCGEDHKNGAQPAANTTGDEFEKPSGDVSGSDQSPEFTDAAESEVGHPTENTDPAEPRSRRSLVARRARRLRNRKSTAIPGIPGPINDDPANTQLEVDSAVSSGFG